MIDKLKCPHCKTIGSATCDFVCEEYSSYACALCDGDIAKITNNTLFLFNTDYKTYLSKTNIDFEEYMKNKINNDPAVLAQPQSIQESRKDSPPQTPPKFYECSDGISVEDVEHLKNLGAPQIVWPEEEFEIIQPKLKVKKLHSDAILPTRAYNKPAGYDIYSLEDMVLISGKTEKVRTGIAIQPPPGWYGKISERGSIGSKGIAVRAGVCDEDYTSEYIVCLTNTNIDWNTRGEPSINTYNIKKGDKIAQVVFHKYGSFEIEEVAEFEETERGEKGFGSSD